MTIGGRGGRLARLTYSTRGLFGDRALRTVRPWRRHHAERVLAVPPSRVPRGAGLWREHRQRDPGVPHHAPRAADPAARRAAHVRPAATGSGPSTRGGRPPCRDQRRVLHAARARQRPRRLRDRPRRDQPGLPARRGRARTSARSRPHGEQRAPAPAVVDARAGPPERSAYRRRAGAASLRAQRPARHPVRQPARAGALRGALPRPRATAELGTLRVPRSPGADVLLRLGHDRPRHGRRAPERGGAQPVRSGAVGPHGCYRPAARSSASSGRGTTSASTGLGRSTYTTRWSATSSSPTRSSSCRRIRGSRSSPTPPSPGRPRRKASRSWGNGQPPGHG